MSELHKEDWGRVDRLFSTALDRPPSDRDRFLRESGAPDDVVARVRRLLAAEQSAEERIGESAEALAEEVMDEARDAPAADLPPGARVGPYRIVREVGRGGMGMIYLAERSDDKYDRQVALKVVKRGMDTDEVVMRFRREGRILARLEHPGIGRMYDADVTPDGRPYLVLEYIDGRPIDTFCDAERLSVEERLRLFLSVCDAVSFAHSKLVLHRDLKPSNILVTEDGPRLLDFGIGKVLGEEEDGTRDLTALVGRRLTPEYASPEQLSGGEISTASDVYALGVVLYELLTGHRPGRTSTRAPSAALTDSIREEDTKTAAASRRSTPQRLARRLLGDLDVILMKALHEDAERRYASVEGFSSDLRRHLEGQPVTARPDSVVYRARKFVSRNRLPVLSGSGIGVSVFFFGIASFLQQAETARERDRAELERTRAEEVSDVLEEMFTGAGFASRDRIDTLTVRQFLDQNAQQVLGELNDQPVVQGTLLRVLGTAQHGFGRLDEADTLLSRAVAVLGSARSEDPRPRLMAQRELGNLRMRQGRWREAQELYQEWFSAGFEPGPEDAAALQQNIGLTLLNQGHFDSATTRLDSALAIHRARPDMDPVAYGESLSMRGGIAQRAGDLALALTLSKQALEITGRELGADHPRVLAMEQNYAFMVYRSGRADEAQPIFEDLVLRYRMAVGESAELSTLLHNYGNVLRDVGRAEEALPFIEEAIGLNRTFGGPALAFSLDALGTTLDALERYDDSRAAYEEALEVSRASFGESHPGTGVVRAKVGSAMCREAEASDDTALELIRVAEEAVMAAYPPDHPAVTDVQLRKSRCYLTLGREAEARVTLEGVISTLEERGGPPEVLDTARELLIRAGGEG